MSTFIKRESTPCWSRLFPDKLKDAYNVDGDSIRMIDLDDDSIRGFFVIVFILYCITLPLPLINPERYFCSACRNLSLNSEEAAKE
jgi:hypothetical protein